MVPCLWRNGWSRRCALFYSSERVLTIALLGPPGANSPLSPRLEFAPWAPKRANVADLISVIVTTYNRPDALDAVLRSLSRQTDRDFEVVVADDGSEPETARLIEDWKPRLGAP